MRQDREYVLTLRVFSSRTSSALQRTLRGRKLAVNLGFAYRHLPNGEEILLHPAIVEKVEPGDREMTAEDALLIAHALGAPRVRISDQQRKISSGSVPVSYADGNARGKKTGSAASLLVDQLASVQRSRKASR